MSELYTSPAERSRKAHTMILSALQEPGSQVAIAASLGASESTISRIKNEKLAECLAFLYAAGFKVVPQDSVCVRADAMSFMREVTARTLSDEEKAKWVLEVGS